MAGQGVLVHDFALFRLLWAGWSFSCKHSGFEV
jgi:hypothetical protein